MKMKMEVPDLLKDFFLTEYDPLTLEKFVMLTEEMSWDGNEYPFNCSPETWISLAFSWMDTTQGFDFWAEIDDKWETYVEAL